MIPTLTSKLAPFLDPVGICLFPEAAQALIDLRADSKFPSRLDELAYKNTEGRLTTEELAELDLYLSAISVVTILQSQARMQLRALSN